MTGYKKRLIRIQDDLDLLLDDIIEDRQSLEVGDAKARVRAIGRYVESALHRVGDALNRLEKD